MVFILFGQALNYLGITNGKLYNFGGYKIDSTYTPQGNSGSNVTKIETLFVNQSFTYSSYNAKGIYTASYYSDNTNNIFEDTVYEISNMLHRLYQIGKHLDGSPYKVDISAILTPFSINNKWNLGLSGPYIGDFDGDGNTQYPDTLWWYSDTAIVVSQENVTVPAGTFNAYKIWFKLNGKIWSSQIKLQAGNYGFSPYSDTLIRNYYVWWVPNTGYVKDSLYSYVRFHGAFSLTIKSKSTEVSVLNSYASYIPERATIIAKNGLLDLKDNAKVYNVQGELVFEGKGRVKLGKGIYLVEGKKSVYKVIVR